MTNHQRIMQAIFKAVDEINQVLSEEQQLEKAVDTVIFGKRGKLDSLGLINLIVAVEQNIEDEFEAPITLADERAMSQKHSPFRTVGTLANYIALLLEEKTNE